MNTFEHLLEQDEYVRKQRALGEQIGLEKGRVEGELEIIRQVLVDVVKKRYPSLIELAQRQASATQNVDVIRSTVSSIIDAPDEATARMLLNSLLDAE